MSAIQPTEMKILRLHYATLCDVMVDIDNLLPYFVQGNIIHRSNFDQIMAEPTTKVKVEMLLQCIFIPVQAGNVKNFRNMLSVMEKHGLPLTRQLAIILRRLADHNNARRKRDMCDYSNINNGFSPSCPMLRRSNVEDLCDDAQCDSNSSSDNGVSVESCQYNKYGIQRSSSPLGGNGCHTTSMGSGDLIYYNNHSHNQNMSSFHENDTSFLTNCNKFSSANNYTPVISHHYQVSSSASNVPKQHLRRQQTNCQYAGWQASYNHNSQASDEISQYQTGGMLGYSKASQEPLNFWLPDYTNSRTQAKPTIQVPSNIVAYVSDPRNGPKFKYDQLEDRLKTYMLPPPWEGPVDAHSMSEAGFVYTGQEDLVFCFSCNIKLDGWTKHMDPLLRHKEESPTCSFVRQQLQVIKGEKGKVKSVVAPSKPLNPRQTASIGQLQSSTLFSSKPIHTVVTGLDEPRSSYSSRGGDDFLLTSLPINAENYRSEAKRIRSFVGWPLNELVHPEQLAEVGFVYTGEGSLVQCFQCGVRYRNWLKGDIPLSVHQRCNPRCAFLHTLTSKSKSIEEQRPTYSFIQPESMLPTTQSEDIALLQFPDYSDQATRLQSFKYWSGVLPKEELAEAGFYMIARRDVVRCFSCHVVLQDWEKSDNVIDEHQRHNPNCTFLIAILSNASTSSCASASINKIYSAEKSFESKSRDYQSAPFDTVVTSLSSLDVRHPPSIGKSSHEPTLHESIVNEGVSRPDDNETQPISGIQYPPSWASNPPPLSPLPGGSDSEENASSQKKLEYNTFTSIQQSIAIASKSKQIMYEEQGIEENNISNTRAGEGKDDEDESTTTVTAGLCQICYDKKIECIFLPCGHARTCEECATRIKNSGQPCPYCRKAVSTTHRIYL